jgi:dienelactone hydrolase
MKAATAGSPSASSAAYFCAALLAPSENLLSLEFTHITSTQLIDHLLSKGIATLIVDSFTPRNELKHVCADLGNLAEEKVVQYFSRDSDDALAALNVLRTLPDIDTTHVFLQGYSYGAVASLKATDKTNSAGHNAEVAGVIAYYPYCNDAIDPSVPVLVMVGDKDDWTPAAKCQAAVGKTDFELVIYPGDTHAFTLNFEEPVDYLGHHMVYDEAATKDAQQRADVFIAAHMPKYAPCPHTSDPGPFQI